MILAAFCVARVSGAAVEIRASTSHGEQRSMPKPSEQISTKWIGNAKRECVKCGVKITNLDKQVGEIRNRYPGPVTEIICMNCHMAKARETLGRDVPS